MTSYINQLKEFEKIIPNMNNKELKNFADRNDMMAEWWSNNSMSQNEFKKAEFFNKKCELIVKEANRRKLH